MVVFCGQSKHKLALRNLSMVMRQVGGDATERQSNIEESVTLAKNAVQLDVTDGTSWCEYHSCRHLFLLLQQLCTCDFAVCRLPSAVHTATPAFDVRSSGLFCGWPGGLELPARFVTFC